MFKRKDTLRANLLVLVLVIFCFGSVMSCRRASISKADVWAEVNGKPIQRSEVERYYRNRMRESAEPTNPTQALSFKLSILNELINNEILADHAARTHVTVTEAEVDTKIAELMSPYSKEEFQQKLKDQGISSGDFRRDVRQGLVINKLIEKEIQPRLQFGEAEIADYYQRNKANFAFPETEYHLAQLQVTPVTDNEIRNLKNDDARDPAAAERKIQALYASLRQGADFAKLAREYSEDPATAAGGGDMGFIPASALRDSPAFEQMVKSLKVGEISGILRTPRGYHIIKLLGREEAGQRELSDPQVQSAIRQTLTNEKGALLRAAYVENLRNRAKVVNHLAQAIVKGVDPATLN